MASTVYGWSTTAASNTNSDTAIALVGTAASIRSADDSMRAIMGRVKEFVADLGAQVTVGGTADAVTITTNAAFSAYAAGQLIRFVPSADNTTATTLNVNSIGAKAIRKISAGADIALTAGDLLAARHADILYDTAANSAAGAWILISVGGSSTDATKLPLAGGTMSGETIFADELVTRPYLKDYAEVVSALGSSGGTRTCDMTVANVFTLTVSSSANTLAITNPPATGRAGSITLIITNGGSQTFNWPASFTWASGTAPTLTTSGVDVVTAFTIDAGTTWRGFLGGLAFS